MPPHLGVQITVVGGHPFDFTMTWKINSCRCQQPVPSSLGTAVKRRPFRRHRCDHQRPSKTSDSPDKAFRPIRGQAHPDCFEVRPKWYILPICLNSIFDKM